MFTEDELDEILACIHTTIGEGLDSDYTLVVKEKVEGLIASFSAPEVEDEDCDCDYCLNNKCDCGVCQREKLRR